jgi:hypothetical protein
VYDEATAAENERVAVEQGDLVYGARVSRHRLKRRRTPATVT